MPVTEWKSDPDTGDLVYQPTGARIPRDLMDNDRVARGGTRLGKIDIDEIKRIVEGDKGPSTPKGATFRLKIEIVDANTIEVTGIVPNQHILPEKLHRGEREKRTLQLYESLRAIAKSPPEEHEVPRLVHLTIKPFAADDGVIEAGEVTNSTAQTYEIVRPKGFMTSGGIAFEELREFGPGHHYVPRHW